MAIQTNIIVATYNNYFNRIVKKEDTVADYVSAAANSVNINNINFAPGDGVYTSLVLGNGENVNIMNWESGSPDYLVVYAYDTEQQTSTIKSRWFIMDTHFTRSGQYELNLRRDVIADNYDNVIDAPCYIEKGLVSAGSPLIFNKEGMLFNQIKKKEERLLDRSGCAWLVAYIGKDASATNVTINYSPEDQNYENVSASNIENWFSSFNVSPNTPFLADPYNISYRTAWQAGEGFSFRYVTRTYIYGTGSFSTEDDVRLFGNDALRADWNADRNTVGNQLLTAYNTYGLATFKSALIDLIGAHSSADVTRIKNYNGKIIKTQDGKYYRITVKAAPTVYTVTNAELTSGNNLWNMMTAAAQTSGAFVSGHTTPDGDSFKYSFTCSQYIITYQEDHTYEVKSNISIGRNKTKDAIYDIIALPYPQSGEAISVHTASNSVNINVTQPVSMSAITSIATALGGGGQASKIYDIQLLPYCPVQTLIDEANGGMLVDEAGAGTEFDWITDNSNSEKIGILFYVPESAFTFDIDKSVYWNQYKIITGFTDINVLPLPYTSVKTNVSYAIPSLANWGGGTIQGRIRALIDNEYANAITCSKINRATGEVIDTVLINDIILTYNSGSTPNMLSCNVVSYNGDTPGWSVPNTSTGYWQWTSTTYDELDYFIEFTINTDSYGGSNVNEVFGQVAKIPVYSSELNGAYAMKIDNECNSYRLVSPNYQGEFEFSPVKNGGVDRFNVDCTYKPYNPYIHVNPDFGGLYGDDFNDNRGLICQGDFTVGMISDAFTQYELQNKNYQQIFNRQIQNMDVSNEIARQEQGFKAVSGAITGGVTGGVAGGMVGGLPGAIAGAVTGSALGLTGGVMDYINMDKQLKENKSYAVDMYNFNLQNIKALPYTMTRCTALTFNNKLFPFIESYSCTDTEKEAFIQKLNYDGMTVNVIGTIQEFTDFDKRMVKGQLIRLPELADDNHIAEEIYSEIKKGVYI